MMLHKHKGQNFQVIISLSLVIECLTVAVLEAVVAKVYACASVTNLWLNIFGICRVQAIRLGLERDTVLVYRSILAGWLNVHIYTYLDF